MSYIEIVLVALSLSIDTLAVSISSSVTMRCARSSRIASVALSFAAIQTLFLGMGWLCGAGVLSLIYRVAGWIGFMLLLYIGGQMIWNAVRGKDEGPVDLSGARAVVMAGVVTSIDASAVGVSYAMAQIDAAELVVSLVATFVVTLVTALVGIVGGSQIGQRWGRPAETVGGVMLILIGLQIVWS